MPEQGAQAPRNNGAPDFREYLHPAMERNYGRWVGHENLRPGVYKHVAEGGEELFTVRAGSPRTLSAAAVRRICDVADRFCDGFLRFTTRSNIEFMLTDEKDVEPLIAAIEGELGLPVGGTGNSIPNILHTQGWLHCNLPGTDALGAVKAIMDELFEEFRSDDLPQRLKISASCCQINCGAHGDIAVILQHHHPPRPDHEMIQACELPKVVGICPVAAIRPARRGGKDTVEVVEEKCMYCGACHGQCPGLEIRDADTDTIAIWVGGKTASTRGGPAFMKLATYGLPNNPPRWPEVGAAVRRIVDAWKAEARPFERVGEWVERVGWKHFFDVTGFEFTRYHIDSYRFARTSFNTSSQARR
ncbi:MAG: dissimilatory-type sulfite reductase subunit beta [Gaiellales bacterium]|nr:MAG: dissimilatory-type sulfite reductase subunit beta [Gaiellales bacterium]